MSEYYLDKHDNVWELVGGDYYTDDDKYQIKKHLREYQN